MSKMLWSLVLLVFALPSHADTIYDVNATAIIAGDTINFILQLDQPTKFITNVLPGGMFSSSGPIDFGSGAINPGPLDGEFGGIALDDHNGTILNLNLGCEGFSPFPCTPSIGWVDFWAFDGQVDNGGVLGGTVFGTITVQPPSVATPEPSTWVLLLCGLTLAWVARKRFTWRT